MQLPSAPLRSNLKSAIDPSSTMSPSVQFVIWIVPLSGVLWVRNQANRGSITESAGQLIETYVSTSASFGF